MDYLHDRVYLDGNQCVRVDSDTQCNIMLTDDVNYGHYRNGASFRYSGGFFKEFPAILFAPYSGNWHVTIDLGGASASIKYSITVITIPA